MSAIVTHDLSKTYKSLGKATVHSLRNVNMEVQENEIYGFLGRNGAGKTTAIKLLTGLIQATKGRAEIFGEDAVLPSARARIGYLPERSQVSGLRGLCPVFYNSKPSSGDGWILPVIC